MKYIIETYGIHELGKRQNQEDSLFPDCGKASADDRLFILCDGMGGHEKGEIASATVCSAISQTILGQWHPDEPLSDELLLQAISAAYDALDDKDDNAERKMGTTLALLCLHANGATVAHIGDSRVYQFRPGTGLVFRTQDHSLVNDLVKIGEITEEEAKHHPQKNVITRAMQPHQPHRAKPDIAHITDIRPGDYFFICSDGMLEHTSDENLVNIIMKSKESNKDKANMLRSLTKDNSDNHTAQLIYIISDAAGDAKPLIPRHANKAPIMTPTSVGLHVAKPKSKKKRLLLISIIAVATLALLSILSYKAILFNDKQAPKPPIEQTAAPPTKKHSKAPKKGLKPVHKKEVLQMGMGTAITKTLTRTLSRELPKKLHNYALHPQDLPRDLSYALYGASGLCGLIAIFQLFKFFELRRKTDE